MQHDRQELQLGLVSLAERISCKNLCSTPTTQKRNYGSCNGNNQSLQQRGDCFWKTPPSIVQWLAEPKSWRAVAMVTTLKRCMGASKELHFGTPHQNTQLRYVAIHAVWFDFQNDAGERPQTAQDKSGTEIGNRNPGTPRGRNQ